MSTLSVCPTQDQEYSVTVTDDEGCSAVGIIEVQAVDVGCSPGSRVEVCHYNPISELYSTICIKANEVQAHLDHGDVLGSCGEDPCAPEQDNSVIGSDFSYASLTPAEPPSNPSFSVESVSGHTIGLYPNPVSETLTIEYAHDAMGDRVELRIFNVQGILEHSVTLDAGVNMLKYAYNASELAPGMYFVHIHDEAFQETLRFVKASH